MVWLSRWTVREDNHKVELRPTSEINEENPQRVPALRDDWDLRLHFATLIIYELAGVQFHCRLPSITWTRLPRRWIGECTICQGAFTDSFLIELSNVRRREKREHNARVLRLARSWISATAGISLSFCPAFCRALLSLFIGVTLSRLLNCSKPERGSLANLLSTFDLILIIGFNFLRFTFFLAT